MASLVLVSHLTEASDGRPSAVCLTSSLTDEGGPEVGAEQLMARRITLDLGQGWKWNHIMQRDVSITQDKGRNSHFGRCLQHFIYWGGREMADESPFSAAEGEFLDGGELCVPEHLKRQMWPHHVA